MEPVTVNPVIYLVDVLRRCSYRSHKPALQILADGNKMIHERPDCPTQQIVLTVFAMQVRHVAAVLAVNAPPCACQCGDYLPLHGSKITGMYNIRSQPSHRSEKIHI